jgi:beta,beta-carotene 9',10'-dioxygenase
MTKAFDIGFGKTDIEVSIDNLPIQGHIPNWVKGDLIRNGPGTFRVGSEQYKHWFDGLAMSHRFSFENGQVSYQNKFLDCNAYQDAITKNKITYAEFATNPKSTFLTRIKSIFKSPMTDSAKVSVAKIGQKMLALSETPMQIKFDPKTLTSLGAFNYDSKVGRHVTTVHPHYDQIRNKSYNITTRFNRVSRYRILEIVESRKPKLICSIPTQEISYMHSFAMSKNYFTITEFPFRVNPLKIVLSGKPFIENYSWYPDRGTVFHVVDRTSNKRIARLKADSFFAFHHINSFEKDGLLFIDILAYRDADVVKAFYLDTIKKDEGLLPLGEFRRYRVDLAKKSIDYEAMGGDLMELPVFDHANYNMQGNYRYVYGVGIKKDKPQSFYNQLVKLDIEEKSIKTWYEPGCYPGEGVFVGNPEQKAEDDGVLLSVVLNEEKQTSFLLILDAATLKEIGRAEVTHPILFGYHGKYFSD